MQKHRRKRFTFFLELLARCPTPVTILDLGGEQWFWKQMGWTERNGVHLKILNLEPKDVYLPNTECIVGDATYLDDYADQSIDIVFSNSVIEHVGTFNDQARMAREITRVGKRYFVQTPNRRFPLEAHFRLPWFQYYPRSVQATLVEKYQLGVMRRADDRVDAIAMVDSVRLLSESDFAALFPDAEIVRERWFGLTKSFIAYHGW